MSSHHKPDADENFLLKMEVLRRKGLSLLLLPGRHSADLENSPVRDRVQQMLNILNQPRKKAINMTGFILYNIENNKVRRQIAKYLEKKGCLRIQKSVFFCNVTRKQWLEMKNSLKQVNDLYDNNDSIFFLPVSKDAIEGATCIGQQFISELQQEKPSVVFL
jgi:CRISPR-associated protein Cas2